MALVCKVSRLRFERDCAPKITEDINENQTAKVLKFLKKPRSLEIQVEKPLTHPARIGCCVCIQVKEQEATRRACVLPICQ